ncbi:MAG: hypothetical protein SFW36_05605 [Leptolyngbyaceae cyanobacterium bins.59]|nr:hypothetical protein [Leptolyngbyaceae cyanobacterium bins.59]
MNRCKLGWPWQWTIASLALVELLNPLSGQGWGQRANAQQATMVPEATAAARVQQREKQERQVREENYDLQQFPVVDQHARHWRNILWTTAIVEPQHNYVEEAVIRILALSERPRLSQPQRRTVLMAMQVGTQLYLSNSEFYNRIGDRLRQTVERSRDPQWVAMALATLNQAATRGKSKALEVSEIQDLGNRVRARFPSWSRNVFLKTTLSDIDQATRATTIPPLKDLLNWTIAPHQIQVYVLCTPDRSVLCQTVVKDKNGQFVRTNGELWSIPLLLRSIHGLSWNFERGETPQGIYRMEGVTPQPDLEYFRAFGQFDLVNLFVPFESGVKQFVPGRSGTLPGSIEAYQALLPSSWRNYWPIQQTYWAGKSGRSLFRIHGSGEGVNFFPGKENPDSADWNPTIGCLSALEVYDETGRLLQADMPKLLNLLRQLGGNKFAGYVVVVEVPKEGKQPLTTAEIEAMIGS